MFSLTFRISEKEYTFYELYRVKGGYCSHRNIYYDFCIAGQERVKGSGSVDKIKKDRHDHVGDNVYTPWTSVITSPFGFGDH